jgi:hypothetical protein
MKTRAKLTEAVAILANKYMHWQSVENSMKLSEAIEDWRNAPTDPPRENKWVGATFNALQNMKNVRNHKLTIEEAIIYIKLEIDYCRAVSKGMPYLPDPKITSDPMVLSDKLSDEEVWLNAFHEVKCERAKISQVEYADTCLDTFKRRFRKEC